MSADVGRWSPVTAARHITASATGLRRGARNATAWLFVMVVLVRQVAPRPVRWLLEHPQRVLTLAWLVGVLVVGTARTASADIIVGPDLAQGAPKTLYETYDFTDYKLTVKPDEENSDWFGIEETVLQVVGFINNLILWACLGVLYGALSLLEWFLNLTLYRDSAPEIDTATRMIADQVFWPLIAATVAVGAFITYARWRGEGHGFLSDFGWVVAAGALAVGFAAGPSQLMDTVDSVRQDLATGVMSGSANYTDKENPTGFPTPEISGDPQTAGTRRLVNSVWDTGGATVWCLSEFRSLDVCKVAGYHALAGDEQWQQWMDTLDNGGAPPEFGEEVQWIRGQDITRTGSLLALALITIPLGLVLLRLVVAGLVASAGFLLMLMIGLLFLGLWPIPGWFRQLGTRYWVYTLGLECQGLLITVVISGSTVGSAIIATQAGKYGFFVVALLNIGLFVSALKARAWLELLTTMGGAGGLGFAAVMLVRSAASTAVRTGSAATRGTWGVARGVMRMGRTGGPALSGFKNAGNWRNSRFGATRRSAPLDEVFPVNASATRLSTPGTSLVRRPSTVMTRTAGHQPPGADKPSVVEGGVVLNTTMSPRGFPNRRFRDSRLAKNLGRIQQETGHHARVWVHKKGVGIAPVDPVTPRERLGGRRLWRHVQAPGERRIVPPSTHGHADD